MEIVRSELLSNFPELVHGFSTKPWGNMSFRNDVDGRADANNREFLAAVGLDQEDKILNPLLNHGNNVAWLHPMTGRGYCEMAIGSVGVMKYSQRASIIPPSPDICVPDQGIDAIWTDAKCIYLTMRPADCAVIYIYDPRTHAFGLVHAGTVGVFSRIAPHALQMGTLWFGIRPANLRCYISPSISGKAYDLRRTGAWTKRLHKLLTLDDAETYDPKIRLQNQLRTCGVLDEHVEISPDCTASDPDKYFSHHRDTKDGPPVTGRMMAIIGLRR